MLKILAFSDTHGSAAAFKKIKRLAGRADILACAGDLSIFSMGLEEILKMYNSLGIPVIVIAGNHETDEDIKKAAKGLDNIIAISDDIYSIGNYHFLCSSGNGFTHVDKQFERVGKSFLRQITKLRDHDRNARFILLTHAPPYGTALDKMLDGHCGNKSIKAFITKGKPDLAISGHIHENQGAIDRIGKTKVINPGPFGVILTV